MIRVVVVDDHPVFRQGVAQAISDAPDLELVGSAASVEELVATVAADAAAGPEIAVLDLGLPGLSGAAAVERIVALGARVLVVSADGSQDAVVDAIGAGASGYLTKASEPYEIIVAVREIARGSTYVSPTLAAYLIRSHRKEQTDAPWALTGRERDVLSLLAEGATDAEIARDLFISVSTVRGHLDRVRDKTGLRRRAQLARLVPPRSNDAGAKKGGA